MRALADRINALALVVCAGLLILIFWRVETIAHSLNHPTHYPADVRAEVRTVTQTVKTTWTAAEGPMEVVTPREKDESASAWATRHREAVEAMQLAFPPVN